MALPNRETHTDIIYGEVLPALTEETSGTDLIVSESQRAKLIDVWHGFKKDFASKRLKDLPATVLRAGHLAVAGPVGFMRITNSEIMSLNHSVFETVNTMPMHQALAPLASFATAWGLNYAWSEFDGAAFNGLVNYFPNTFEPVSRLSKVKKITGSLNGLDSPHDKDVINVQERHQSLRTRTLNLAGKAKDETFDQANLALSMQGPGIVGFVVAGGANGMDKHARKELQHRLSRSNASFLGLIAMATAVSVEIAGQENAFGQEVSSLSGNKLFWLAIAFGAKPLVNRVIKPAISMVKQDSELAWDSIKRSGRKTKARETRQLQITYNTAVSEA